MAQLRSSDTNSDFLLRSRHEVLCREAWRSGWLTIGEQLPLLLTVEEAGRLLRVGRSHAYNQVTLYFASGGTDGVPALRLGGLLRVPKHALDELVTTGRVAISSLTLPWTPPRPSPRARTCAELPCSTVAARIGLTDAAPRSHYPNHAARKEQTGARRHDVTTGACSGAARGSRR